MILEDAGHALSRTSALDHGPLYDMPHLISLEVHAIDLRIVFFERFAACPRLRQLTIGKDPHVDARDLENTIRQHRSATNAEAAGFPALRKLILTSEWGYVDVQALYALEDFCCASGIDCEVESPDSDEEATMEDHEMDEGVSEGSDEDLVDGNASFT